LYGEVYKLLTRIVSCAERWN